MEKRNVVDLASEEFERDAMNLVVKEGYTITAATRAVGVLAGSLRAWHRKYAPEPEPCAESATIEELKAENKRLRKKLRDAEIERETLKKATA
ncbi:MAG: transposase [Planctomycetota bacterium]